MKQILGVLFFVMCVVVSSSCKKDEETKGLVVKAVVENGNDYNSMIDEVKACVYYDATGNENFVLGFIATGKYEKGGFNLTLPSVIDNKYLTKLDGLIGIESIIISDPNLMLAPIEEFVGYQGADPVGVFSFGNGIETEAEIETLATYFYSDRNASVKGELSSIEDDYTMTLVYDMTLKKGWNLVYAIISGDPVTGFTTLVTTTSVDNLKWQFYDDMTGKAKAIKKFPVLF
jgi:hypothetical protein